MYRVLALVSLLLFGAADDGTDAGRRGNELYEQGDYAAAESAYRRGLNALADTTGAVYASLQNNLGAALHRQQEFAAARTAFLRAARAASTDAERARALYNAGTAAAGAGRTQTALDHFRRALVHRPDHEDARFNYEYLKREQARGQSRPRSGPDVEPSAYAKRLKRRAEELVAEERYEQAHQLMVDGLRKDSTVAAYRDFMARLRDVADIDRVSPSSQQ